MIVMTDVVLTSLGSYTSVI